MNERDQLSRRHLSRRLRMLVVAGMVAAAGGATVAALLGAFGSHAPSALATVTSALAHTSAETYSFSLETVKPSTAGKAPPIVVSGAFDPSHELGTELLNTRWENHPVEMQIRFIGKYVYTWMSAGSGLGTLAEPWDKALIPPAGTDPMPPGDLYGFVTDRPVSAAELSGVLKSAGMVRDRGSASGTGWTGTRYAFTARYSGGRDSVNGTVYVDQQGRVRRLVTITTRGKLTTDRDLTFSGFGVPVPVTVPASSQVQYSDTPYWGFFF